MLLPPLLFLLACGEREREIAPPAAVPPSATATQADALTGARAIDLVGAHLTQTNVYPAVSTTCLNLAARGQRDRGWVIEAFDGCSLNERQTHRSIRPLAHRLGHEADKAFRMNGRSMVRGGSFASDPGDPSRAEEHARAPARFLRRPR